MPFGALSQPSQCPVCSHRRLRRLDLDCSLCGGTLKQAMGNQSLLCRPSPETFHPPRVLLSRLAVQTLAVINGSNICSCLVQIFVDTHKQAGMMERMHRTSNRLSLYNDICLAPAALFFCYNNLLVNAVFQFVYVRNYANKAVAVSKA